MVTLISSLKSISPYASESTKPSAEAEHALSAIRQVCVCVFPNDWDKVLETQQQVSDKFSTGNAEIVENIKIN